MRVETTFAGRRWSTGGGHFADPDDLITAWEVGEVMAALARAQSAANAGAWVAGFVSYEAAPGLDSRLVTHSPGRDLPLVCFGVYRTPSERDEATAEGEVAIGEWKAAMSPASHAAAVASIQGAIGRGDTYQANLTFTMSGELSGTSSTLFSEMLAAQPDSYGALIDLGEVQIVSVSPELFISVDGGRAVSKPMKGTAPRGRWPEEDLGRGLSLGESEKERAGNLMIVDMVRNDLGRVSKVGSVVVPELFSLERHPTVWQMTSSVESQLRDEVDLVDLFQACFPAASVTGAPKPSTVQIITDHELGPRGAYCGAIGYLEPGGARMEFSVAIRTGVVRDTTFTYHVGGGITWGSSAGTEYDECRWKALVAIDAFDRPALLETMRFEPGEGIPLLERHVARMADSAAFWDIPFDPAVVGEELSAIHPAHISRVRLILGITGAIEVEVAPLVVSEDPVPLRFGDVTVDPDDPLWFHKTLDRSRYPKPVGPIEEILINTDGMVTETNRSALFVEIDGEWVTPPLETGLLPGIGRAMVLEDGKAVERPLTVDQLATADGLAVVNALRGWRTAHLIG